MIIDFKKIIELHNKNIFNRNDVLRLDFSYNNYRSFFIYSSTEDLKWTFTIFWEIKDEYLIQNYRVFWVKKEKVFKFNPYLENEIYGNVKAIFKPIENPLEDYFNKFFSSLDNIVPQIERFSNIRNYEQLSTQENIYFNHFQRKPMSDTMKKRLSKYGLTNPEINFLIQRGLTAYFVSNISRARDIKNCFKNLKV